jgi:AcrR family transcriptional regulator
VPTGVAIRDARRQLFDAADRILLRDGPDALTSRAVTTEAGVAKGVLHRHFTDFDDFLAQFVLDRADLLITQAASLRSSAGTATVVANLAEALTTVFQSVAVSIVALLIFRDGLRARLRQTWPTGVPLLTEAVSMTETYLRAEQAERRIAPDADIASLALTLIGAAHLLFADRTGAPPSPAGVRKMITTVIGGVLVDPTR